MKSIYICQYAYFRPSFLSQAHRIIRCCIRLSRVPAQQRISAAVAALDTQQTRLLCHTTDMSSLSRSRHVCCVTHQTCLLCGTTEDVCLPPLSGWPGRHRPGQPRKAKKVKSTIHEQQIHIYVYISMHISDQALCRRHTKSYDAQDFPAFLHSDGFLLLMLRFRPCGIMGKSPNWGQGEQKKVEQQTIQKG